MDIKGNQRLKIAAFVQKALYDLADMGLDSVELVMAAEETFDIEITDEEATSVRTVGDTLELVVSKLQTAGKSTCQSQRAFHIQRKGALELFDIPRRQFRSNSPA